MIVLQVPKGGWFSLLMTAVYGWTMITWFYGSGAKARCALQAGIPELLQQSPKSRLTCFLLPPEQLLPADATDPGAVSGTAQPIAATTGSAAAASAATSTAPARQ